MFIIHVIQPITETEGAEYFLDPERKLYYKSFIRCTIFGL